MPLTGTLIAPEDPIPPYPPVPIDLVNPFPRDWSNVAYIGAAKFGVEVDGAPANWSLSYKWSLLGEPGGHRYLLRVHEYLPPGISLMPETFAPGVTDVWLPFLSRREIDLDHLRDKADVFTIECVVKAEEPGFFSSGEEVITLSVTLTFQHALYVRDMAQQDRYALAFEYSAPHWPDSVRDAAIELFTDPAAIAMMVGFTALFVALAIAPFGWTQLVATALGGALLAIYGAQVLEQLGKALWALDDDCGSAETDADLQSAGKRFAENCGAVVFSLLLAFVFWRVSTWASQAASAYKTVRLQVIQSIKAEMAAVGYTPSLPTAVLTALETATVLIKRMSLTNFFRVKTGIGPQFTRGTESNKAYSIDRPHKFKNEHLKDPAKYRIEHRIEMNNEIRQFLKLAVNDNAIPAVLLPKARRIPRYKHEHGRVTVLIPDELWPEFMVMYNYVEIVIVPISPTEDVEEQDEETFVAE